MTRAEMVKNLRSLLVLIEPHDGCDLATFKAQCDTLQAAIEELQKPVLEWQPIETAPKDGTKILLFGREYDWSEPDVHKARWGDNSYSEKREAWCIANSTDRDYCTDDEVDFPTHWMPLPSPPVPTEDR